MLKIALLILLVIIIAVATAFVLAIIFIITLIFDRASRNQLFRLQFIGEVEISDEKVSITFLRNPIFYEVDFPVDLLRIDENLEELDFGFYGGLRAYTVEIIATREILMEDLLSSKNRRFVREVRIVSRAKPEELKYSKREIISRFEEGSG